jgi:hypothetical protein
MASEPVSCDAIKSFLEPPGPHNHAKHGHGQGAATKRGDTSCSISEPHSEAPHHWSAPRLRRVRAAAASSAASRCASRELQVRRCASRELGGEQGQLPRARRRAGASSCGHGASTKSVYFLFTKLMRDSGLPADVLVGKLNKDISFALRRGTIAQVTTHHACPRRYAGYAAQRALVRRGRGAPPSSRPQQTSDERQATSRRAGIAKHSLLIFFPLVNSTKLLKVL